MKKQVSLTKEIDCGDTTCDNCPYRETKSIDCFCATTSEKYIDEDNYVNYCELFEMMLEHNSGEVLRSEDCISGEDLTK